MSSSAWISLSNGVGLRTMKYSVIVLLEKKYRGFSQFIQNLYEAFCSRQMPFEIVIVANSTGGFLRTELTELQSCNGKLKAFELNTKTSQAACLKVGLKESSGQIIVVCGSYQQLTTAALYHLLDALDDQVDIISPWRRQRVDPPFNALQSRIFNAVVRKITNSDLHDLSCTVKVFRREVLENTEIYGNMYRFLPILAERKGYKTKEIECEHYQERGKTGFYSSSEYLTRIIDIFTLYFNTRFTRKPLRFFSSIGLGFLLAGLFIMSSVFGTKIFLGHPIGDRPILLLAIFFMVLGVQAASVGLLGEIIAFTYGRHRKEYSIDRTI
jgi:hypothetical protein